MKLDYNSIKFTILFIVFTVLFPNAQAQNTDSDSLYYMVYDDFVGIENSELNNGTSFLQQFRSLDKSHTFFGFNEFVEGYISYKKQIYKTRFKYDILDDLVIVKYIESSNIFSLSLNSKLIDFFSIGNHQFVKLPNHQELSSYYGNGFFEEHYKSETFSFYTKHLKKTKSNTEKGAIHYYFKDGNTFWFSYENEFYEVNSKKDIYKVLPHLKKHILNHFKTHPKVSSESLALLFKQLDKINTK